MEEETKLEQYGEIYSAMCIEGDGYYFYGYASPGSFDFDQELRTKFEQAANALEEFKELLEERIIGEGGSPEDYEA